MAELRGVSDEHIHFGSKSPKSLWQDIWSCWGWLGTHHRCHTNYKHEHVIVVFRYKVNPCSIFACRKKSLEVKAETAGCILFFWRCQSSAVMWILTSSIPSRLVYLHQKDRSRVKIWKDCTKQKSTQALKCILFYLFLINHKSVFLTGNWSDSRQEAVSAD